MIPIDSRRSDDEPIARSSGACSIFTSTAFGAATGAAAGAAAACAFGASGVSALAGVASCVYSPVSSARARSEDVNNPIAER